MISAGALIWISVRPLIRLVLCVSCGYIITKADLLPVVAAGSIGQIILNITLPALMFSKMVPAFTPDNISALGPLILVAIIYELLGAFMAYLVKQFFWVPHRFRYGILVAGGWANWGDIPTAVIMSITGQAPFGGSDQTLSVAYISAFILVYMMTLFPMGGHHLIAMDFVGPDVEPDEVREETRQRRKLILYGWPKALLRIRHQRRVKFDAEEPEVKEIDPQAHYNDVEKDKSSILQNRPSCSRNISYHEDVTTAVPTDGVATPALTENILSPPETVIAHESEYGRDRQEEAAAITSPRRPQPRRQLILSRMKMALKAALTPGSLAMLISIPIALVPELKGLFTATANSHIPYAPDGAPPLAFILDFATFMGNASVPLGLISLGSALARMNIPRNHQWSTLPIGAILGLATLKMIVEPILGVLITIGLTNAGVIAKDDKVLQFVCMFFSCLPTATTQVFITQVYSGTGSAEYLSPFLLPQYFLMFFSMTGITAFSLSYLF